MTTLLHIWQYHHASDFAAGVRLLAEHNPGAVTNLILDRLKKAAAPGQKPNRYEVGKLTEALQKTVMGAGTQPPVTPGKPNESAPVATPQPEPVPAPPLRTGEVSGEVLQKAWDAWNRGQDGAREGNTPTSDRARALHKAHSRAHALMSAAKTDEERAQYAREIMEDILPALDAEYDRLRAEAAAKERGETEASTATEPDAPTGPILNAADTRTFKKLQSVRSRISTLKGKIKSEKDPAKKAKWQKELQDKTAERDRLEKELA